MVNMHVNLIYKVLSLAALWAGIALLANGGQMMYDSAYRPPKTPAGWAMGMLWVTAGISLAISWVIFMTSRLLDQWISGKPRWSTTKMMSFSLILLGAAGMGIAGTFMTWRYPYRIGPCDCSLTEWGPNCEPCLCSDHGVCDSGTYGSGRCSCDFGWDGPRCDVCDDRHKGEDCDICKTGYAGERCEYCARGYDGEECDICAPGWREWQNYSTLFPYVISSDDNRHICDECAPNHFGYYCRPCPWGNDAPKRTLQRNTPIIKGTRAADNQNRGGSIEQMQVYADDTWSDSFDYNDQDFKVLEHARVKIKYDYTHQISPWIELADLRGLQCNNRGICTDDDMHQAQNPNWQDTCTFDPLGNNDGGFCTTDDDCTVSENCQGICQGTLPTPVLWTLQMDGVACKTDEDCFRSDIFVDELNNTYSGGQCVSRACCKESRHGNGRCQCDPQYFGTEDPDSELIPHFQKSPACDFCPGYDWMTEEPSTICSGGKGTCLTSNSRTGEYLQMRCKCGQAPYIPPDTGIPDPTRIIQWTKDLCQAGDWDDDNEYDICASGYWGPDCEQCPGGFGLMSCSGHGTCHGSSTNSGTGQCICDIKPNSAWMLAPFIKRYSSERVGRDVYGTTNTCSECAPNHHGNTCQECPDVQQMIAAQLTDIFQPANTYTAQSSSIPAPLCHPQKPTMCWTACGRGGWCNWGRQGDGTCTCWSNRRFNPDTWNPVDSVCIGNDRYDGPLENYTGIGERCPSYGRCSGGDSGRNTLDTCGPQDFIGNKNMSQTIFESGWTPQSDWTGAVKQCPGTQTCFARNAIDYTPKRKSCELDQ